MPGIYNREMEEYSLDMVPDNRIMGAPEHNSLDIRIEPAHIFFDLFYYSFGIIESAFNERNESGSCDLLNDYTIV